MNYLATSVILATIPPDEEKTGAVLPLRIAVCLSQFHPIVGGAERQILQLAQRWVQQGNPVTVLTRPLAGLPRNETIEGIQVRRVLSTVNVGPLFGLSLLGSIACSLVRLAGHYDVVLAAQAPWEAVAAGLTCPLIRRPSVIRIASVGPRGDLAQLQLAKGAWIWRRCLRRNRLFLAPSARARDELLAAGCQEARIRSMTNGVDIRRFRPRDAPEDDPAAVDSSVAASHTVLFVGRLAKDKNPLAVLRAWRHVKSTYRHRLLIAGDGPMRAALAAYVAGNRLRNVELLGERHDMTDLYGRAGVCVVSSAHEGCSNALLEAMASGLCPVVSRVPGNVEVVEHEVNGLTFTLEDDRELAATLERVLADDPLRIRLAQAARQHMLDRHDLDRIAAEYLELFQELIARG